MLQKLRDYCAREDIRARLMIGILALIVLVYAMVTIFGRSMPPENPNKPLILRVHPERLLAMVAAVTGSVRLADHFQKGENPIPPLFWIFCASLIHLMSIGVQLGWFSAGQG
ncbi:MAG TPA: hypothetical protein VFB14_17770 [Bryobacteraceae bacterium]|jgi:hypothetical protein|nr:hypothetical protein [Bryobacteraceae bacterium]